MNCTPARWHDLDLLLDRVLDGLYSEDDARRLNDILRADDEACRHYAAYLELHGRLAWGDGFQADPEWDAVAGDAGLGDLEIWRFGDFGIRDSGMGIGDSGIGIRDFHVPNLQISKSPNQQIPLSPLPSPLSPLTVGGPVFSYIAATLILGVMLLSAWAYTITHDYDSTIVHNSRRSTTSGKPSSQRPEFIVVGRVTGMKDCRWSDPQTEAYAGAAVPLGRKYALSSGLMEITYRSGAKVILEGPCRYEVESAAGGFLALGKLTAKVESGEWRVESGKRRKSVKDTKGVKAEGRRADNLQISKSPNLQINSPLSPLPSPLFSVRTPTAVVTDLGTEFGVEVSESGDTTSHVFQGTVVVQSVAAASTRREPSSESSKSQIPNPKSQIILAAGESVQVGRVRETHQEPSAEGDTGKASGTLHFTHPATPPKFVRRINEPPKLLDLLDIVAGGDGTGVRRERGIDQATGEQDTWYADRVRHDDHEYHRVPWNRFVDGVFVPYVPSYRSRTVQLDSSGNAFNGFTDRRMIDGALKHEIVNGKTTGSIWARAADASSAAEGWSRDGLVYALNNDKIFMPAGRGLMLLHSNAGITFDLAAMREMFKDVYPARLRATVGMGDGPRAHPHAFGMADLWVFVDGRLAWKRLDLCAKDGAVAIDLPLGPDDGFLTIVSTNGRYGQGYDWVVLGDPALETKPLKGN